MKSDSNILPKPLRGIIPPMVTPLLDRDALDVAGLERLIEHILGGGVHGLFILGTTGEGPSLSYRLRYEFIERVCGQVNGRVPILVGITDTSFTESVNTARKAKESGAQAVVLAPPYYFPFAQSELLEYLKHLTAELPLSLFLYNFPSYTKVAYEPETVKAAAYLDGIVGIKDSSGDISYLSKLQPLLKNRPEFSLLIGPDRLMTEAISSGANGGICGGANLVPELYVNLYNAIVSKDLPTVEALNKKVMYICTNIYHVNKHESSYLKGLKCALSCMGICSDFVAEPYRRFGPEERDVIRRHLKELGISLSD
jgi:dihydrodipicolinate synthase/N-acetylneuraminate lyase